MAITFEIHPDNPQTRFLVQASQMLDKGGLVAVPTDSSYAVVAKLDDKSAAEALRKLRGLDDRHNLTLLCKDLTEISNFAKVDNQQYRFLKLATPGPWTFILEATREIPRRVSHPSKKTIGIRVPNHNITLELLKAAGSTLISTTLIPPNETQAMNNAQEIEERFGHLLSGIIDGGACALEPTTVIDLTGSEPEVLRHGLGDLASIGLD